RWRTDPLNSQTFQLPGHGSARASLLALPRAEPTIGSELRGIPQGTLVECWFDGPSGAGVTQSRSGWIYTPSEPPASAGAAAAEDPPALLVLFDGASYVDIGIAAMLDELIHQRSIGPTVCVLLEPIDRESELCCNAEWARELAETLLPTLRATLDTT